ncbi:MAG: DoxX family protein [bacterium]
MLEKIIRNQAPVGLLCLRLTLGIIFLAHGSQKLTPWFGGQGISGTIDGFTQMGMFYPQVMAILVALGEFFGGLFLVIGLFSREASVVIIIIMIGAIVTVHWKNGFFLSQQGFEYNFALIGGALCILFGGAGILSLDSILFPQEKWRFVKDPSRFRVEPPME